MKTSTRLIVAMAAECRRMIQQSGEAISIEHTGLRPGEKLHEVLFGQGEHDSRPNHPLISQVSVPPLSFDAAQAACSVDGRLAMSPATLAVAADWGTAGSPHDPARTAAAGAAEPPTYGDLA